MGASAKAAAKPEPAAKAAAAQAAEPGAVTAADRARWAQLAIGMARPRLAASGAGPPLDEEGIGPSLRAMSESRGEPMPVGEAARFGAALGVRTDDVHIHTDAAAQRAVQAVGAKAVTAGRHVYFGQGQFRPGTAEGDRLLKHELTHTAQQRTSGPTPAASGGPSLSRPGDPDERAATRAEATPVPASATAATAPPPAGRVEPPSGVGRLQRQVLDPLNLIPALFPVEVVLGVRAGQAYAHRNDVVELQGHPRFEPNQHLADWIWMQDQAGRSTWVNWQFGTLAHGRLEIVRDPQGRYVSAPQTAGLELEGLGDEDPDSISVLQVQVVNDLVRGVFGGVRAGTSLTDQGLVTAELFAQGGLRLLRWRGLEQLRQLAAGAGELLNGHLAFQRTFAFDLGGAFHGEGTLAVHDGRVSFDADATIEVPGLETTQLHVSLDPSGRLSASGRIGFTFAGFRGNVLASFSRGVLDIRGTVSYSRDGFDGSVTVMVTDEASAWSAVNGQIAQWGPAAMSALSPTRAGGGGGGGGAAPSAPPAAGGAAVPPGGALGPPPAPVAAPGGGGGGAPAPAGPAPASGPRRHALAGWGVVGFRYKDWLTGRAQVIVAPDGHITSLGRIHVPRSFVFLPERRWPSRNLVEPYTSRVALFSWWDIFEINVTGRLALTAEASLGPGLLTGVYAEGWFSTRPGAENVLRIGGTLEMRAMAALQLELSVGIHARTQFPLTGGLIGWDLASLDLNFNPRASVEAIASATAAVSRHSRTGESGADYLVNGSLDFNARAALALRGGGTLDLARAHKFVLFSFDGSYWELGRLAAHVPFRRHVLGSEPERPSPRLGGYPGMSRMLRGIVTGRGFHSGRPRPDDAEARWLDRGTQDPIAEQPEPTAPSIPADPHFGRPTTPPVSQAPMQPPPTAAAPVPAPAPATPPPPPGPPPADAAAPPAPPQGGGMDAGVITPPATPTPYDAGAPIAGTPLPEEPEPRVEIPPAPAETPPAGALDVPFEMEHVPHHLTLRPGHPPVLIMASAPGRLTLKLQRKKQVIEGEIPNTLNQGRLALLRQQRDVLDELIVESTAVEQRAADLGFGDRPGPSVPGLAELAARLQGVADQFDWRDLDAFIPGGAGVQPPSGSEEPPGPPTAPEALNLPFDRFMEHVAGLQPAEALPLLRDQRRFYEQELGDIDRYLAPRPRGTVADDVRRRQRLITDRIRLLDVEIRRLELSVNPGSRGRLPCFSPDTPVLVPGGVRPIGAMRVGDRIACRDPVTGETAVGSVVEVHRNLTLRFILVTAGGQTVRATGKHLFWVEDAGDWVRAEDLARGMRLRLHDGTACEVHSVEEERVVDAPTVDLSVEPFPTYFVGPGLWVHNTPVHLSFVDPASGNVLPTGPFKIYVGTNVVDPGFANCTYVGQTNRSRIKRQEEHQTEARDWLDEHPTVPESDPEKRYYRFKRNMTIEVVVDGIIAHDDNIFAKYLEQLNINIERGMRPYANVMNRREEVTDMPGMAVRIRADGRARSYCP